jgi:hypothetical protein
MLIILASILTSILASTRHDPHVDSKYLRAFSLACSAKRQPTIAHAYHHGIIRGCKDLSSESATTKHQTSKPSHSPTNRHLNSKHHKPTSTTSQQQPPSHPKHHNKSNEPPTASDSLQQPSYTQANRSLHQQQQQPPTSRCTASSNTSQAVVQAK